MPLCSWWSAKRPVMYFFMSKFKLINVIILEWQARTPLSSLPQITSHHQPGLYLLVIAVSFLICRAARFSAEVFTVTSCQKIFNLTLKSFRFTLDHLKFCQYSFTPNSRAHATSCYRRRPWGALYYGERHLSVFQAFIHASSWTLNSHFSQKLRLQT